MAVSRILRISLTTAMPEVLGNFYMDVFGFEFVSRSHMWRSHFSDFGLPEAGAQVILLRLGEQMLELVAFDRSGAPYPSDVAANDLQFQHFAIVVCNMAAAYSKLLRFSGWTSITRSGPQQLPASSGGVSAFKFRDPEGHPLELIAFPVSRAPLRWQRKELNRLFLGIDHSAICVRDTERSVEFYKRILGLSIRSKSLNVGKEQEELDDLPHPTIEVTALAPETSDPPHLELLCYRSPRLKTQPPQLAINAIAATRLVLQVDGLAELADGLAARKSGLDIFPERARHSAADSMLIRDPDGHALDLEGV